MNTDRNLTNTDSFMLNEILRMNNSSNSTISFMPGPIYDTPLFAVFIIFGCLIVAGNFITILTFVINKHLRRRSVYCLLNLAVVDMLFGVVIIVNQLFLVNPIVILFFFFFFVACLSALTLVAVERVYATFFPFRQCTTKMYVIGFIIAWIIPVPELIPMSYTNVDTANERDIFILVVYLVCLLAICVSYTAIFIKVKIQAKRLQANQQQPAGVQIRQKREQHLAMTLFIVTVASLIAWLPYTSLSTSQLMVSTYSDDFYDSITVQITLLIQSTNSLINPIIYVFRMRDFRKALSRLVLMKCLRDQQIQPIGHHGNYNRHHEAGPQDMQQFN